MFVESSGSKPYNFLHFNILHENLSVKKIAFTKADLH